MIVKVIGIKDGQHGVTEVLLEYAKHGYLGSEQYWAGREAIHEDKRVLSKEEAKEIVKRLIECIHYRKNDLVI